MTITYAYTIYSEEFDQDRDEMIQRALIKVFPDFFIPAIDSSYTQAMYDLENYPEHVFLMGLHPTHVKENYLEELQHVEEEAKRKFYAIGEIGIDLYWDKTIY
jgi:TatD DNase family protein